MAAVDVRNDIQANLIPNAVVIPAMVGEVSRLQQHGYTLVLDVAQQQTPVLYAVDSTNITKPIIEAYNTKSGVPAPPAQPAGAAPAVPPTPKPAPKTPPASH